MYSVVSYIVIKVVNYEFIIMFPILYHTRSKSLLTYCICTENDLPFKDSPSSDPTIRSGSPIRCGVSSYADVEPVILQVYYRDHSMDHCLMILCRECVQGLDVEESVS